MNEAWTQELGKLSLTGLKDLDKGCEISQGWSDSGYHQPLETELENMPS